jgi:hypothetical protein
VKSDGCIAAILLLALTTAPASPARADAPPAFTAKGGLEQATDAAHTWAEDSFLIYLENDEPVGAAGEAQRWGYLFHSPSRGTSRAYSIQDGKIRVASDLGFEFSSPPLPAVWVDSRAAHSAAEDDGGRDYREKTGGQIQSMFLVGGLLHPKDPEAPTWAVFYASPNEPGLWIVVDAQTGPVVRTWRG